MNKATGIFCGICICLSGIITVKGQSGITDPDSLFLAGDYSRAALYYSLREFQAEDPGERLASRIQQATCLKLSGSYGEAAELLDQTPPFRLDERKRSQLFYESALCHYLSGMPAAALSRYLQAEGVLNQSEFRKEGQLLAALCYLDLEEWDKAHAMGLVLLESTGADSIRIASWNLFFDQDHRPKLKDPRRARILSMIIPGSGQMYAGNGGSGLFNLGIHLATLGGAVLGFTQGYYVTAWLGGLGLFQRFYQGGVKRAEELCEIKNRQLVDDYLLPVKRFLIQSLSSKSYPST